ncbi:MAG: cupin domain-containing protein [Chloroflexi bacterium]|nr:cupin domain-containing protein [Chloroflexota bacterium]
MTERVTHIPKGSGKSLWILTDLITFKIVGSDSGGNLFFIEIEVLPQAGPPLHAHPCHETFYVLEGEVEFTGVDGDERYTVTASAGSTLSIPNMVFHAYRNVGTTKAKMVCATAPAGLEKFFEDLGLPVTDPTTPPTPEQLPSPEAIGALFEKHHMRFMP